MWLDEPERPLAGVVSWRIVEGDCRAVLAGLPERSVQTCVTSPPYFGLRDYGTGEWDGGDAGCDHAGPPKASESSGLKNDGRPEPGRKGYELSATVPFRDLCGKCGARRVDRIGLEPTPDEFVAALVAVFRAVRRVLRDDGTVWLNLGDSYNAAGRSGHGTRVGFKQGTNRASANGSDACRPNVDGLKEKDLIGIPWMVAFALRADGWYLRSDIIWNKPNPMPESVTDRPTKAHEYLFLLSKGPRYFWDADAIREDNAESTLRIHSSPNVQARAGEWKIAGNADRKDGDSRSLDNGGVNHSNGRNKRSVWTVATAPFAGAHFATFPPKLIEPCILAGSPPKCCGVCGAPWRRVVERTAMVEPPTSRTVGWESTCAHDDDTGSSVILDPFAGSGTVGVVSGWHGREHIGIELNPEYAAMARARIALEGRPGGRPNGHEAPSLIAGQLLLEELA